MSSLIAADVIEPWDNYIPKDVLDDLIPSIRQECTVNGQLYSWPFLLDIIIMGWNAGQAGMYDPATNTWKEWKLPGDKPQAYAVYVDERDKVWFTDFAGDGAIVRFDPATEKFDSFPLPHADGNVRQLLGRPGEVWGAESASDQAARPRPSLPRSACLRTPSVDVRYNRLSPLIVVVRMTSGRIIRIRRTKSPTISSFPHFSNVSSMLKE